MEKTYVVWSPDKVLWDLHEKADTYQGLINAQKKHECSVSSIVHTNSIEEVVEAFFNETDVEIKYHMLEEATTETNHGGDDDS